jgi:hypothetical protein
VDYVLGLTGKPRPRVCLIPTATGDHPDRIVQFYGRHAGTGAECTHLALFERTVTDIRAFLLNQDLILVSGGNTANMLAVWRVHGIDRVLREAWDAGIILCGGSAGSLYHRLIAESFPAGYAIDDAAIRFVGVEVKEARFTVPAVGGVWSDTLRAWCRRREKPHRYQYAPPPQVPDHLDAYPPGPFPRSGREQRGVSEGEARLEKRRARPWV